MRQVGKTWLMVEFGKQNYKNSVYLSFDNNPLARAIFSKDFNTVRIIKELEIANKIKINPNETLIILDEIQECPLALTSLKYFQENAPMYHVIAAGSFLGVINFEGSGFPVGKLDRITLYPMTFLEFLEAIGENRFVRLIDELDFSSLSTFKDKIIELLKQYFCVGGMPEVVKMYVNTRNFDDVRNVQKNIIKDYYADFSKHIPPRDIAKVRLLWDSVPIQLAKENKRFLYSDMKRNSRGRDYETALKWLEDTGLVYKLNRISLPNMPLLAYAENSIFKLYAPDIGLLLAQAELDSKIYFEEDNKIFSHYKGTLAEQFVLQELKANNPDRPIYYWANNKNTAEIEFIIQLANKIIPIEVKSGNNTKSASLIAYINQFEPTIAIQTSLRDYNKNNMLYSIPLYSIAKIKKIIDLI
jgi:predicted AAA+ superfamily ATPase